MASITDDLGRTLTSSVLDQNELLKQLADSLRSGLTDAPTKHSEDKTDEKIVAALKSLPKDIYEELSDDIDEVKDYIEEIRDYLKEQSKAKEKPKSERQDQIVDAITQLGDNLIKNLSSAAQSGHLASLAGSVGVIAVGINSLVGYSSVIANATSSMSKQALHKGSLFVHDIHTQAILLQLQKDFRAFAGSSMKFEDPIGGDDFIQAVKMSGMKLPPKDADDGVTPDDSGMSVPDLSAVEKSSDRLFINSESIEKAITATVKQLKTAGKYTDLQAETVKSQIEDLARKGKLTTKELDQLQYLIKNLKSVNNKIDRENIEMGIKRLAQGDDFEKQLKGFNTYTERWNKQIMGTSVILKDIQKNAIIDINNKLFNMVQSTIAGVHEGFELKKVWEGIWGEQVKHNTQLREALYTSMGLTASMDNIRNQYMAASREASSVAETGQHILMNQVTYRKNLKMGIRDLNNLNRITRTGLNLSTMIGANAEQTADVFARWHLQTGFTTNQMSQLNRQIRFAGQATGVVGDELLQAVSAARELADAMRDAGNLTADAAGQFVQFTAAAKKYGTEKSLSPLLKGMSSSVELMERASDQTKALLFQAAASVGKVDKLRTGQVMNSPEDRKAMTQGIEKVLNSHFARFGASIDDFSKLTDDQKFQLNMQLQSAYGIQLGEAQRLVQTLREGSMTYEDRLKNINARLKDNLTQQERSALIEQRRQMVLQQALSDLTKLDEKAKTAKSMDEAFTAAKVTQEETRKKLTETITDLNDALGKAGKSKYQIDPKRIEGALKDPTQYRELLAGINSAEQKAGIAQKSAIDPILQAQQTVNELSAKIVEYTGSMAQTLLGILGSTGIIIASLFSILISMNTGRQLLFTLIDRFTSSVSKIPEMLKGKWASFMGKGAPSAGGIADAPVKDPVSTLLGAKDAMAKTTEAAKAQIAAEELLRNARTVAVTSTTSATGATLVNTSATAASATSTTADTSATLANAGATTASATSTAADTGATLTNTGATGASTASKIWNTIVTAKNTAVTWLQTVATQALSIGQWLLTGGLMAAATATWAAVAAAWAFLAPLLPIALAIGALVAVIYYFWDTIKGFFSWLGPVIDWFKKIISTIGGFFGFGKSKKVAEEAPGAPQMPASASTQTAPPSATTTAMASSGNTDGILNKIEQHLATLVSMAQKGGGGAGGGGTATLEKNKGGVLPGIDAQPVQAAANNLSEAKKALPDAKNMMLDILGIFAWIGGYAIVLSYFAGMSVMFGVIAAQTLVVGTVLFGSISFILTVLSGLLNLLTSSLQSITESINSFTETVNSSELGKSLVVFTVAIFSFMGWMYALSAVMGYWSVVGAAIAVVAVVTLGAAILVGMALSMLLFGVSMMNNTLTSGIQSVVGSMNSLVETLNSSSIWTVFVAYSASILMFSAWVMALSSVMGYWSAIGILLGITATVTLGASIVVGMGLALLLYGVSMMNNALTNGILSVVESMNTLHETVKSSNVWGVFKTYTAAMFTFSAWVAALAITMSYWTVIGAYISMIAATALIGSAVVGLALTALLYGITFMNNTISGSIASCVESMNNFSNIVTSNNLLTSSTSYATALATLSLWIMAVGVSLSSFGIMAGIGLLYMAGGLITAGVIIFALSAILDSVKSIMDSLGGSVLGLAKSFQSMQDAVKTLTQYDPSMIKTSWDSVKSYMTLLGSTVVSMKGDVSALYAELKPAIKEGKKISKEFNDIISGTAGIFNNINMDKMEGMGSNFKDSVLKGIPSGDQLKNTFQEAKTKLLDIARVLPELYSEMSNLKSQIDGGFSLFGIGSGSQLKQGSKFASMFTEISEKVAGIFANLDTGRLKDVGKNFSSEIISQLPKREELKSSFEQLKTWMLGIKDLIKDDMEPMIKELKTEITDKLVKRGVQLADALQKMVVDISSIFERIQVVNLGESFRGLSKETVESLPKPDELTQTFDLLKNWMQKTVREVVPKLQAVTDELTSSISSSLNKGTEISHKFGDMVKKLAQMFRNLNVQELKESVSGFMEAWGSDGLPDASKIKDTLSKITEWIKSIFGPDGPMKMLEKSMSGGGDLANIEADADSMKANSAKIKKALDALQVSFENMNTSEAVSAYFEMRDAVRANKLESIGADEMKETIQKVKDFVKSASDALKDNNSGPKASGGGGNSGGGTNTSTATPSPSGGKKDSTALSDEADDALKMGGHKGSFYVHDIHCEQILMNIASILGGMVGDEGAVSTMAPVQMSAVPMGEESVETSIEKQLASSSPPSSIGAANQQLAEIATNTSNTADGVRQVNATLNQILAALSGTGGGSGSSSSGGEESTATRDMPSSTPVWPKLMYNYNGGARKRYIQVGV